MRKSHEFQCDVLFKNSDFAKNQLLFLKKESLHFVLSPSTWYQSHCTSQKMCRRGIVEPGPDEQLRLILAEMKSNPRVRNEKEKNIRNRWPMTVDVQYNRHEHGSVFLDCLAFF